MLPRVLLSWSSGKDSAWTLHILRQQEVEVVALLTTFNEAADRVAMHAVRRALVEAQARAAGLPLWQVPLPWPCSNATYEERMIEVIVRAREEGITHVAFGDLFLQDIRDYRIRQLAGTGVEPLFPLWCSPADTPDLARRMLHGGLRAVLTCVDPKQLSERFVGRTYDAGLLADLPSGVDPCGERGEFHTFCFGGPMFAFEIAAEVGETVSRGGFCFADLVPCASVVNSQEAANNGIQRFGVPPPLMLTVKPK
ncbi:MAG: adenine nucleotide alpha hydrolase [candidate division Zixibacteria bacterium]|nr:adenine nucleotide alpha hydrolase [candidate division Zixibacteria bacterium]